MESDKAIQYLTFLAISQFTDLGSQLSVKKKKFNNINTVSSQGFSGSKEANSEIYNVNEHNSVALAKKWRLRWLYYSSWIHH